MAAAGSTRIVDERAYTDIEYCLNFWGVNIENYTQAYRIHDEADVWKAMDDFSELLLNIHNKLTVDFYHRNDGAVHRFVDTEHIANAAGN
jgi:hypothetical protein